MHLVCGVQPTGGGIGLRQRRRGRVELIPVDGQAAAALRGLRTEMTSIRLHTP
jgi:hypothetical protein